MVHLVSQIAISGVVLCAIIYQFFIKTLLVDNLGVGRVLTSLDAFPYRCQKVEFPGLEACEDMWFYEPKGYLYLACSDSQSRTKWLPPIEHFNASARGKNDRIAMIDTRGPGPIESRIQWLTTENFSGINGDGTLNLHGFSVRYTAKSDVLRFLVINHRPPLDSETGAALDAKVVGANSTVEMFQTVAGSSTIKHIRTYTNENIMTPNRVAWVSDHSFLFTNDHNVKVGSTKRRLEAIVGGGSVGYCDRTRCSIAYDSGFNFPNGLVRGRDGLIYVPSSVTGKVQVFSLTEQRTLEPVDSFQVPYPVDNISVDEYGDLYAATFPQGYKFPKAAKNISFILPTAVFKIHKDKKQDTYEITKILEDDSGTLPGATSAIHDAQTGRIFLGGSISPYISVCEANQAYV